MSAFICQPEHFALLASECAYRDLIPSTDHEVFGAAQMLWMANVRSVRCRYPRRSQLPGPMLTLREQSLAIRQFVERYRLRKPLPSRSVVVKAIDCYNYNASEGGRYETSRAHNLVSRLLAALAPTPQAAKRLRASLCYKTAAWPFEDIADSPAAVDHLYENSRVKRLAA